MKHFLFTSSFSFAAMLLFTTIASAQMEFIDDQYTPGLHLIQQRTPAFHGSGPMFEFHQVNVDQDGNNIVGDAANEPSMAVNPKNPKKMVMGWRQFDDVTNNFRQAGVAYSINGGLTWLNNGPLQEGIFRSDPVLSVDADGKFYYNSLTLANGNYTCTVFRSTGDGTWDEGTAAFGGDKQWMTIDRTEGPGKGFIYADWNQSFSSCGTGFFTRSSDGGNYYDLCTEPQPGSLHWGTMDVGPEGNLYLSGTDGDFSRSSNAQIEGQSPFWEPRDADMNGYVNGFASPGPSPLGLLGQIWVATNHAQGLHYGEVYTAGTIQQNDNPDDLSDMMFIASADGGDTWTTPVRINDDPFGSNNLQWMGVMSVAPNGRIDAAWLDSRDFPGTYLSSLYYSNSYDGGLTWSPNVRLSDEFDPTIGWPNQAKMGDYYHMISDNDGAHLAWAATFNGEEDVYYGHITPEPVVAVHENTDIQANTLLQNAPNPCVNGTNIQFELATSGSASVVIYDQRGVAVRQLPASSGEVGKHNVYWDIKNNDGQTVSGGVYFYKLLVDGKVVDTKRLVVIKS